MEQKDDLLRLIGFLKRKKYPLSSIQENQLYLYLELLNKYKNVQNLVSLRDRDLLVSNHFVDSCLYCDIIRDILSPIDKPLQIVDIGTGAGFPGILIAVLLGQHVVLVDSNRKKTLFLRKVVREIDIDAEVVNDRIENYANNVGPEFDLVTARGLTALSALVPMAEPLLRNSGFMITIKGANYKDEINYPIKESMFLVDVPGKSWVKFSSHLSSKKTIIYRKTNAFSV